MTLSANEAISKYIEYYDRLMENLEKKRVFMFDRAKTLKLMNMDTILKIKKMSKGEEKQDETAKTAAEPSKKSREETKVNFPPREEQKNDDVLNERRNKVAGGKLWSIIKKQESKTKMYNSSRGTPSSSSSHYNTIPKPEYMTATNPLAKK